MRILVAEDEKITRRVLQRHLESWGHEVVLAKNGLEAWVRFQQEAFSMVISDWNMPILNGPELVQRIRSTETSGYVYIVLLTAKSDKADIVAGIEGGADDFLSKPVRLGELIEVFQALHPEEARLETGDQKPTTNLH